MLEMMPALSLHTIPFEEPCLRHSSGDLLLSNLQIIRRCRLRDEARAVHETWEHFTLTTL